MQINEQQPVDRLIRTAAPATVADTPDIDRVLAELAAGIMAANPAGPRTAAVIELKRRRRRMILAPAAAITLLLSTAAGYALWHQTDSPDFAQALDRYANALPLPPGTDSAAYVASVAAQGTALAGSMSDAGVESMASYYGFCAWATAWERRDAAGDHAGAASAASSLKKAAEAPALARDDGGGVVANLRSVANAATRVDREPVEQELRNNCSGLPLGGVR